MSTRKQVVSQLATMLDQAARASAARGAQYEPGEKISTDSAAAWKAVAETLVNMVEVMLKKHGDLEETDAGTT